MNKNTRKFIWNGIWAIALVVSGAIQLNGEMTFWSWIFFMITMFIAARFWRKVEETFKEE